MFGFNAEQVYKDEVGALNNRRTDIEFDLGDYARQGWGALFGKDYSKEGLLKGAAAIKNQQLKDAYGGRAKAAQQNLGPLAATYQGPGTSTVQEIEAQIGDDELRGRTLVEAQSSNPYLNTSQLNQNSTAGQIAALPGQQLKAGKESDSDKATEKVYAREDALTERMNIREDRKDERARLERLENKRSELELRRDNMNLEYARMERQDRRAAQDRRDKNIMMLMQGLGNLGTAFTI